MSIPVIQQAKIQAQVLVPLVKALQAELGEERANSLVRKALGDIYRRFGEEFWRTRTETSLGTIRKALPSEQPRKQSAKTAVVRPSRHRACSPDAADVDQPTISLPEKNCAISIAAVSAASEPWTVFSPIDLA